MHTYIIKKANRDDFSRSKTFTMDAEDIVALRKMLLKKTTVNDVTSVYFSQGDLIMSRPVGYISSGSARRAYYWITDKSAYDLKKDGSLGTRHRFHR